MTDAPLPLRAEALQPLTGFLRGVERRATVLAEAQCGNARQGDQAVAAAMLAFRHAAAERPLPDWDLHFWRLLLATPQLRGPQGNAAAPLAALGRGLRAVVLLSLLAQLDDAQAAAALCVEPALYQRALRRVLESPQFGEAHRTDLAALLQQRLRDLPADRLVRLARHRERALHGAPPARPRLRDARHWQRALPVAAVGVLAIAFGATFLLDGSGGVHGARPHALPAARPQQMFDSDFALITHRDFDQLAAPVDHAAVDDLGFYAWYAVRTAADAPAEPPAQSAGSQPGSRDASH